MHDASDISPVDELVRLHEGIDTQAVTVAAWHGERIRCASGCSSCCRDGITVFTVEAARIRREASELLDDGEPHPEGACAFLDAGGRCRIYESRPYVCRTQGLPLRWLERPEGASDEDDEIVERRDICPLNDESGPPLETLPAEACWPIGPVEQTLAALQSRFQADRDGADLERIALRDLFRRPAGPAAGPAFPERAFDV